MLTAPTSGDIKNFGLVLRDLVADVLSYHDLAGEKPERVYHAFVLGQLVNPGRRYRVDSNRELENSNSAIKYWEREAPLFEVVIFRFFKFHSGSRVNSNWLHVFLPESWR